MLEKIEKDFNINKIGFSLYLQLDEIVEDERWLAAQQLFEAHGRRGAVADYVDPPF